MTCLSKIEGNPACMTCDLQKYIRQDGLNGNYLEKSNLPQGMEIVTKSKDAMAGIPKRQVIYCGRGLGMPVE